MKGPAIALTKCFFCLGSNEILIQRKNINFTDRRIERLNGHVVNMHPCSKCKELMKQGVILITIDDEKSGKDWNKPPADCPACNGAGYIDQWSNRRCEACKGDGKGGHSFIPDPYRTGGFFVLKDDAIRRAIHPADMAEWALKYRWMFIEHKAAEMMGLFAIAKANPEKNATP